MSIDYQTPRIQAMARRWRAGAEMSPDEVTIGSSVHPCVRLSSVSRQLRERASDWIESYRFSVQVLGGLMEIDDQPSRGGTVVYGGTTYRVAEITEDAFGLIWQLHLTDQYGG